MINAVLNAQNSLQITHRNRSLLFYIRVDNETALELDNKKLNICSRAVARSENLGGHVLLGGDNVPPLVEIGLTDLPKSGGGTCPPTPPLATGLLLSEKMRQFQKIIF